MSRARFKRITRVRPLYENQDFYKEIFFVYNLGKISMVCPFRISGSFGNRKLTPYGIFDVIYYVKCIIFCSFIVFAYVWEKVVPLEHIRAFFSIFTAIICIVSGFVQRNRTLKTLRMIENLDRKVTESGIPLTYGKIRRISLLKMLMLTSLHVVMIVIVVFVDSYPLDQVYIVFSLIGSNIVSKLYLDQFIKFVLILRERLRDINEYLSNNIRFVGDENLEKVLECYDVIWQLSRIINFNYGIPLLFGIGSAFFSSTSYIYTWLKFEKLLIPQMLFLFTQIFFLIHLPNICHMCIDEVKIRFILIISLFDINNLVRFIYLETVLYCNDLDHDLDLYFHFFNVNFRISNMNPYFSPRYWRQQ